MNFRGLIESYQDEILENNYKLHQDSDSGIEWYEDGDLDKSYDEAVEKIDEEIEAELGTMSVVILKDGRIFTQRIHKIENYNKKNVVAIIQNGLTIYTNGYFRIAISD